MNTNTTENNTNGNNNKEDYTRVDGWSWREIVEAFGVDLNRFLHLYSLHPDMLKDGGYKRKMNDNRYKFVGEDCAFDRDFVVEKLFNQFVQLDCYDSDTIDDLLSDVKGKLQEKQQEQQTEKIERINQLAKELGLTKKELTAQIKV
jgi:hypothetical protein